MSVVMLVPQIAAATPSAAPSAEKAQAKFKLKTKKEIKEYVKDKKDVNILLYDETGKIINEFHSDGNEIQYFYDAQGNMVESTDSFNGKQVYETDKAKKDKPKKVKTYIHNQLVEEKEFVEDSADVSAEVSSGPEELLFEKNHSNNLITPLSATVYEDTVIDGINMNQLISDTQFTNSTTMTSDAIQDFFVSKGSILKDTVLIYYLTSSGTTYFKGDTINAASSIASNAKSYGINPKVILATLQKESALVTAKPGDVSYSSRRFYYAMGYGATDSGDDYTKAGFNVQISGGTATLKKRYDEAPATGYPRKLPDGTVTSINYGKTVTSNGVTYNNYVWVKNKATYSLYRYTPHTVDNKLLPTIGGGNYLFVSIAKGWWGSTLWN
nr:RHS repeat domain-containing protein [Paenibacillus sp. F411]